MTHSNFEHSDDPEKHPFFLCLLLQHLSREHPDMVENLTEEGGEVVFEIDFDFFIEKFGL